MQQHNFIPTKELTQENLESLKSKTFNLLNSSLLGDKKYTTDTNKIQ